MIDRNYEHMIALTPAITALHEVDALYGHSSPEVSPSALRRTSLDEPLLQELLNRWEARYRTGRPMGTPGMGHLEIAAPGKPKADRRVVATSPARLEHGEHGSDVGRWPLSYPDSWRHHSRVPGGSWGFLVFGDFPDEWTISGTVILSVSGLYIVYRENRLTRAF